MKLVSFLDQVNKKELAFKIASDPDQRFDLALSLE